MRYIISFRVCRIHGYIIILNIIYKAYVESDIRKMQMPLIHQLYLYHFNNTLRTFTKINR